MDLSSFTWVTPASTRASIWWSNIGLLANSTRGFGLDSVNGLNRVPYPPTRMSAFILDNFSSVESKRKQSNQKFDMSKKRSSQDSAKTWKMQPNSNRIIIFGKNREHSKQGDLPDLPMARNGCRFVKY